MASFVERMLRASVLDKAVYEEVEADPQATWQAVGVVVLSSLAAGLGRGARGGIGAVVFEALVVLLSWYAWAYITYFVGTRLLAETGTRADHGELLRTLGFSSAPGVLCLLGLVPGLAAVVFGVVSVWMLAAMVVALRQALDYRSLLRALAVCGLSGFLVLLLILLLASSLTGSRL